MKIIKKALKLYQDNTLVATAAVFLGLTVFFSLIYYTVDGVSTMDDHFFHYKYSKLLRTEGMGINDNFDWIVYSRYGSGEGKEAFSTSLFHYLSIPFTFFEDDITGLKAMDIFWGALMLSLLFLFLRIIKAPGPLLWVMLILTPYSIFTWTLCGRNYLGILPLILFELLFAVKKNRKLLFGIILLHILLHRSTFFIPLVLAGIAELARFLQVKKIYWQNFLVAGGATVVGMMFYPGFPGSFFKLGRTIFFLHADLLSEKSYGRIEGTELLKVSWNSYFDRSEIFLFVFAVGIAMAAYFSFLKVKNAKKGETKNSGAIDQMLLKAIALFCLTAFFGSILASGRLVFFFFVTAVALGAIALKVVLGNKRLAIAPKLKKFVILSVTIFLLFSIANTVKVFREKSKDPSYEMFQDSAEWISARSRPGEVVFIDNWSFFPVMFFYNSKNYYTMGLEPRELLETDRDLFWKWYNIRYNQYLCGEQADCEEDWSAEFGKFTSIQDRDDFERSAAEKMVETIKNDFHSQFIFSQDIKLNRVLNKNKDLFADSFEAFPDEKKSSFVRSFELK